MDRLNAACVSDVKKNNPPLLRLLSRSQEALKTGHFVSVLQVLMQLQRVCNHPELVAPRENSGAFFCPSIQYNVPSLVLGALRDDADKVRCTSVRCAVCSLSVLVP